MGRNTICQLIIIMIMKICESRTHLKDEWKKVLQMDERHGSESGEAGTDYADYADYVIGGSDADHIDAETRSLLDSKSKEHAFPWMVRILGKCGGRWLQEITIRLDFLNFDITVQYSKNTFFMKIYLYEFMTLKL